jgi:hypothetical protein
MLIKFVNTPNLEQENKKHLIATIRCFFKGIREVFQGGGCVIKNTLWQL